MTPNIQKLAARYWRARAGYKRVVDRTSDDPAANRFFDAEVSLARAIVAANPAIPPEPSPVDANLFVAAAFVHPHLFVVFGHPKDETGSLKSHELLVIPMNAIGGMSYYAGNDA